MQLTMPRQKRHTVTRKPRLDRAAYSPPDLTSVALIKNALILEPSLTYSVGEETRSEPHLTLKCLMIPYVL